MGKEITFDKFIRWAGVTLIVLAVLYMTNYLSSVLLPFFVHGFRLPALSGREVYRKQTPRQNTCAVYPHRHGNGYRCYRRRAVAHHPSDD